MELPGEIPNRQVWIILGSFCVWKKSQSVTLLSDHIMFVVFQWTTFLYKATKSGAFCVAFRNRNLSWGPKFRCSAQVEWQYPYLCELFTGIFVFVTLFHNFWLYHSITWLKLFGSYPNGDENFVESKALLDYSKLSDGTEIVKPSSMALSEYHFLLLIGNKVKVCFGHM